MLCCKTDDSIPDCSTVLCSAFNLNIKIIDSTSSNYIIKNNITEDDINIKDTENKLIDLYIIFNSSSDYNGFFGFLATASNNPIISIKNLEDIIVTYTIIPPQTNSCCDFGSIENLMVSNYQFKFNHELNILTIYL